MAHWWKRMNLLAKIDRDFYFDKSDAENFGMWQYIWIGQMPTTVHFSMFYGTIRTLASEE
jgi:hypothetical protein